MSNSNGRIYIDTSVTPNIGISIADIQTVLGNGRKDIGGLITHGDINPWAKYKPTRARGVNPVDWWKGEDVNMHSAGTVHTCGLDITEYQTLASYKTAVDNENYGWGYLRPRGIAAQSGEYFRMLDFNNYFRGSTSPFVSIDIDNIYATSASGVISLTAYFTRGDYQLGLSDFDFLSGKYFGCALYNASGTLFGIGTAPDTIGDALNTSLRCPFTTPSSTGTYYLYPFFSAESHTWSSTDTMTTHYLIPLPLGKKQVNVVNNVPYLTVSGSVRYDGTMGGSYVNYDVVLHAGGMSGKTFTNVRVYVGMSDSEPAAFASRVVTASTTVSAGGTQSFSGTFQMRTDITEQNLYTLYDSGGMVYAVCNNSDVMPGSAGLTKLAV